MLNGLGTSSLDELSTSRNMAVALVLNVNSSPSSSLAYCPSGNPTVVPAAEPSPIAKYSSSMLAITGASLTSLRWTITVNFVLPGPGANSFSSNTSNSQVKLSMSSKFSVSVSGLRTLSSPLGLISNRSSNAWSQLDPSAVLIRKYTSSPSSSTPTNVSTSVPAAL